MYPKIVCIRVSLTLILSRFFSRKNPENYRFVQFYKISDKKKKVGVQIGNEGDVIDLTSCGLPNTLIKCLRVDNFMELASKFVSNGKNVVSKYNINLLPPVTNPDKIICAAANYTGYCKASKIPIPKRPIIFSKFPSTIIGPNDTIQIPYSSEQVDWETELAVIIGKRCKNVQEKDVEDYIFGYTLAQDITARDWNTKNGGQFVLGKSMDTFCPIGPVVVSKKNLDPNRLKIRCWLNGKVKQNASTSDIIYKTDYLISYLSKLMTLLPGDVILTGTPAGVGGHGKPPRFLKCGDVLKSQLQGVGEMVNRVQ